MRLRAKGVDYKVRDLLDDFSAGLGSQLTDQPEAEADMHATIGRAYRSLKLAEKAQPHFEKAIELHRAEHPQSERLAAVMVDGAWNLLDQQRRAEAESQANQALAIYRGAASRAPPSSMPWKSCSISSEGPPAARKTPSASPKRRWRSPAKAARSFPTRRICCIDTPI